MSKRKGLKPSERQKIKEMRNKVQKKAGDSVTKEKTQIPVYKKIIEKGIKDPDVGKEKTEYLKRKKAQIEKAEEEGEFTVNEVDPESKKEMKNAWKKVIADEEKKGNIESKKKRRKKGKERDV